MTLPELFCPRHRARHSPLSGQRPARGSRAAALPASAELHAPGPACPTAGPPHEMLADPSIPAEAAGDAEGALARPHTELPFWLAMIKIAQ